MIVERRVLHSDAPAWPRIFLRSLAAIVLLVSGAGLWAGESGKTIDFDREIRPIFSENCYACHGPDETKRKAGLRLDRKDGAFKELKDGKFAIVAGDAEKSELARRIATTDADDQMPPPDSGKSLTKVQIALLQRWISSGAKWEGHWSFVTPKRPSVPKSQKQAMAAQPD